MKETKFLTEKDCDTTIYTSIQYTKVSTIEIDHQVDTSKCGLKMVLLSASTDYTAVTQPYCVHSKSYSTSLQPVLYNYKEAHNKQEKN